MDNKLEIINIFLKINYLLQQELCATLVNQIEMEIVILMELLMNLEFIKEL